MEELERVSYDLVAAPCVRADGTYNFCEAHRAIRVYRDVDSRLTLEDFFAKLAINYGGERFASCE